MGVDYLVVRSYLIPCTRSILLLLPLYHNGTVDAGSCITIHHILCTLYFYPSRYIAMDRWIRQTSALAQSGSANRRSDRAGIGSSSAEVVREIFDFSSARILFPQQMACSPSLLTLPSGSSIRSLGLIPAIPSPVCLIAVVFSCLRYVWSPEYTDIRNTNSALMD